MPSTSPLGAQLGVEGLLLQMGIGSPVVYTTIANVEDLDLPTTAKIVETTNVGDAWVRRFPTLFDMGKITFKIFWIPTETTHENLAGGLRYLLLNKILTTFKVVYPDTGASTDTFPAFVTDFHITGKVGDVFHAAIELSNNGAPTLV
jgi:hypothetical protein